MDQCKHEIRLNLPLGYVQVPSQKPFQHYINCYCHCENVHVLQVKTMQYTHLTDPITNERIKPAPISWI